MKKPAHPPQPRSSRAIREWAEHQLKMLFAPVRNDPPVARQRAAAIDTVCEYAAAQLTGAYRLRNAERPLWHPLHVALGEIHYGRLERFTVPDDSSGEMHPAAFEEAIQIVSTFGVKVLDIDDFGFGEHWVGNQRLKHRLDPDLSGFMVLGEVMFLSDRIRGVLEHYAEHRCPDALKLQPDEAMAILLAANALYLLQQHLDRLARNLGWEVFPLDWEVCDQQNDLDHEGSGGTMG